MNKTITILSLALAFIGGFLVFYNPKSTPLPTQENSSESEMQQKWESKVDDQASITVTVTPILLLEKSGEWKFDVVMDTHSVELDQDMVKVAVLVDNNGKEYEPLRWEGVGVGGHHREGILVFGVINPMPSYLELKIRSVGGVERLFKWEIK